nr:MAG TPA: hypothetical protein [Caudoviricetes sp.]
MLLIQTLKMIIYSLTLIIWNAYAKTVITKNILAIMKKNIYLMRMEM